MCIKSERIKFCTCPDNKINKELEDYWVLNRFNPDKNECIIGSAILPTMHRDNDFDQNCHLILKALNTSEAFDKSMDFQVKDCLEVITPGHDEDFEAFIYTFEFTGKEWIIKWKNPFDLMNHYDEIKKGPFKYY